MLRIHTGVLVALCAATALAGFALGRRTAPDPTVAASANAPTPGELAASVRAALGEADLLDRAARTASLLEQLDAENLPGVRAVYDEMLPIAGQWEIRPFVAAWARFDPAGALDAAIAWPYRMKREIGVEAAMEGWALRDPEAARQTYERLAKERPALREKLLLGLLAGWVHSAQEGLDGYIAGLPPGAADTATSIAVGALLRKGGVDATLAWAGGIVRDETRDDELKRSVFRRATRAVARSDPERAAAWALEHAGSGWASDGPRLVVEQWGARDGPAALRWVHDHVSGEARPQATREAFAEWLRADPAGAKVWLESESLTEFHDPVLDVYASRLDDRAPQEAIGWCERIVDAERERGCLQAAAIEWYRRDPVAAEAWLQQSPLDEAARHVARRPAPLRQQRGRGALRPRPPADAPQSR